MSNKLRPKRFTAAPGLEVKLWASEPDLVNIDIDSRGRIRVLEAVNYRRQPKGEKDYRDAGDRIVILEDPGHTGRATKTKVFVQDPSIRAPLGISVLGDKVIVSQSPNITVYTKDEDDHIVKNEVLLTGWKGVDHDHGVHAVVFGHDGRYYLNSGDPGFDTTDPSGNHLVSSKSAPTTSAVSSVRVVVSVSARERPLATGLTRHFEWRSTMEGIQQLIAATTRAAQRTQRAVVTQWTCEGRGYRCGSATV